MRKATLMLLLILCAAVCFAATEQPVITPSPATEGVITPTQPDAGGLTTIADESYRIREEDVIRLDVFGEPQLNNIQMLVTPDGKVSVPFLGPMQAQGLTQAELVQQIVKKFEAEDLLINPKVDIAILNLHKPRVKVLGEVFRPGDVEFKEGDRVMDAIAGAGSYRETAWLANAKMMRKGKDQPIPIDLKKLFAGDMSQNYELQKSDVIFIPPENYENKIYVLGFVRQPGIYSLKDRTTVLAAISLAGGPNERGAVKGTVVVRGDPKNPERVQCNLSRLFAKGDLTQDIELKSGDVVVVPETNKPDWNKVSSILGTIMNLTYLRRYGLF